MLHIYNINIFIKKTNSYNYKTEIKIKIAVISAEFVAFVNLINKYFLYIYLNVLKIKIFSAMLHRRQFL